MIWWLVDNAFWMYVLLGILALGLAGWWWSNRRTGGIIALGVVAGLGGLLWLLTMVTVTDRQKIRANLFAMARAVEEGNTEALFQHLSKNFGFQTLDLPAFKEMARRNVATGRVGQVYIWNLDFEKPPDGKKALLAFHVRASTDWGEGMYLCRGDFVYEDNQWKLLTVRFFNPVANTDQPMQIPIP